MTPGWTVLYGLLLWIYYNLSLTNYYLSIKLQHLLSLHSPYTPALAAADAAPKIQGFLVSPTKDQGGAGIGSGGR